MKKVLVLGAGLVARPLVNYLLDQPDFAVTVADVEPGRAAKLVGAHPRGTAEVLDIGDRNALGAAIGRAQVVVSMVPYTFHPIVAELAVERGVSVVTASYVKPAMQALDAKARENGVTLLNEVGLDPGIDHMEAMRVIHEIHDAGGRVLGFTSWCGGFPAPEANTNPFGYKFSWSPRGVLLASKNSAQFLKDGRVVSIPSADLFARPETIGIPGLGDFEGYPNRDSIQYKEAYGIPEAGTVFRGTLRYPGWCETLRKMVELGLLDETARDRTGQTWLGLVRELAQAAPGADVKAAVSSRLGLPAASPIPARLEWLGLFDEKPLPAPLASALDNLTALMIERMSYGPGERDMVVLQHEFLAQTGGRTERIVSTLIDYGVPGGDSSMSRTVGLPAAIGARFILEGRIGLKGVQVPVVPEIYGPILDELERLGVRFREKRQAL
ncbi:MAG TPA: saccharopine dehydrogenase C-terminal domain-containing protein [Candidatus Aminicenantes bacterium]|nr:saccharopine dehydrogenase C-terminal domain-containing protein [Candidatus Aminicenantes bacterium]HRY65135.1 saccharopine dehydrogenase C-terminal domain-containing protein [Candidatus Aminicenantes bacterium]HRZ72397.1 saccharopine dehydrogenase C-terminal domain-containing protein [Candidatus Aminicenantes bacterium]